MFEPRVAIASLSGQSDAEWALAVEDAIGAAFLGGIAIDEAPRAAARRIVRDRDREEFLPDDPIAFVDRQLAELEGAALKPGFNVRSSTVGPVREAAAVCATHDAVLEINAHCRQEELCAAGCGEALLADTERLCRYVSAAAAEGPPVSVKVRAEVSGVDLTETAARIDAAGADIVHVDAMDSESVVEPISETTDLFVIANNGVRDDESTVEYLEYGADAVSVGRASDRPDLLEAVGRSTASWFGKREARP